MWHVRSSSALTPPWPTWKEPCSFYLVFIDVVIDNVSRVHNLVWVGFEFDVSWVVVAACARTHGAIVGLETTCGEHPKLLLTA